MASGDFLDLSEHACRASQLDPADTTDLTQAKAKVNEGYRSICYSGDPWDFLEKEGQWTTTSGSDKYSFSSIATGMSITGATIREIHNLVYDSPGSGWMLESMSWQALETYTLSTQDNEAGGPPTAWAKWGNQNDAVLRLSPEPDATYTIGAFVSLKGAVLSADGDTPIIPIEWRHRVLVPFAAWKLLTQEGGTEALGAARVMREEYEDAFKEMRTACATAKKPTFRAAQPGLMEREMAGGGWWVEGL